MPWGFNSGSASSGAATGAAVGSVVPGIGTGIGGAVGGVIGGLSRLGRRCDRSSCLKGHEKFVGQAQNSGAAWDRVDDMAAVLGFIPMNQFGGQYNQAGYAGMHREKVLQMTGTTIEDWLRIHLDVWVPMCEAMGDPLTCDAERGKEAIAHQEAVRTAFRQKLAAGQIAGISRPGRGSTGGDPDFAPAGLPSIQPAQAGFGGSFGLVAIAAVALFALRR